MTSDLHALMRPFAIAIFAKAKALRDLKLRDAPKRRFLESISDDIKKASTLHPHEVSEAAFEQARATGIHDLHQRTWHEQQKFDPGRKQFLVEHVRTVSALRAKCVSATDEEAVLRVLMSEVKVAWITRDEDDALTDLGYRSDRPETAYEEAGIKIRPRRE